MITRGEARGGGFSSSRSLNLALINQHGQHSFYVLSISFNLVLVLAISVREIQRSEISDVACIILNVFVIRAFLRKSREVIGRFSIGSLSIGLLSIGCLYIVSLSIGSFSIGSFSIGSFSIGSLSIGSLSIGSLSIGKPVYRELYSLGRLSI